MSSKADLWGNTEAFDIVNYSQTEGAQPEFKQESFDILFASSGDLRCLLESVDSLTQLSKRVKYINIHLNDSDHMVAARNLLMLHFLLAKKENGIDAAINIWYSLALTVQQGVCFKYETVFPLIVKSRGSNFFEAFKIKLEERGDLKVDLSRECLMLLKDMAIKESTDQEKLYDIITLRADTYNRD